MKDQAHELKERLLKPASRVCVYAVVSGKGGVGKSNITLNLGIALHQTGKRVLLIDGDLGMANLDILAGIISRNTLMDYFDDQRGLEEILVTYRPGLEILPGGSGFMGLGDHREDELKEFVSLLIGSGRYDYVFIDAGAGIDAKLLSFVSVANEVLLVTVPEPTAMVDAYSLVKILAVHEIKPRIQLIVNQVSGRREAQATYEHLNRVIGAFLNIELELLGYVVSDAKVRAAVSQQVPLMLAHPSAFAARNIREIGERMTSGAVPAAFGSLNDVVHRFVRIFGS
jgi:flagellar biosynthesis protein FlhG